MHSSSLDNDTIRDPDDSDAGVLVDREFWSGHPGSEKSFDHARYRRYRPSIWVQRQRRMFIHLVMLASFVYVQMTGSR